MSGLFTYLKETQRLIRGQKQELSNPDDLIDYVNRARRKVAERTMCVRVLTPITGSIKQASIVAGGTLYSNPAVSISPPDFPSGNPPFPNGAQATGVAQQVNGSITNVDISFGGFGYFQPAITITDPTGKGASIAAILTSINVLTRGQEVYPFSSVDLSSFPGVGSIYMVRSVSVIFANYRYSLPIYSFSEYQARIRQYPFQYQYVPYFGAQFGQGVGGSFYMYPIPSQFYQMEWDAFCLPSDLLDDQGTEVIPQPWADSVPYYAAHQAMLELQNYNAARAMLELFDREVREQSFAARPGRWINPYGRP